MNTGREGDLGVDLEPLEDRGVDALIFATVMTRPVRLATRWARHSVILLNCFDDRAALPSVLPDDRAGGATAARLATDWGHKRIAWLGGERGTSPADARLDGYRDALKACGIPFDRSLVRFGNWHSDSGYDAARAMLCLRRPPTALLCGNDRIALGAYDAVKELGLRIPDDVSIVGYDDQEEIVRYMRPPLTTIRLPYYEMGEVAAATILDATALPRQLLECAPVIRGSLASLNGKYEMAHGLRKTWLTES